MPRLFRAVGKTRGAVAFLTLNGHEVLWDVKRFDYAYRKTQGQLEERKPPFYTNLMNTVKFASIRNDL